MRPAVLLLLLLSACRPDEEGIPTPVKNIVLTGKGYNRWLKIEPGAADRYEEVVFNDSLHLTVRSFDFRDSVFTDTLNKEDQQYNYRIASDMYTIETVKTTGNNYEDMFQYQGDSLFTINDLYYNIPLKRFR